MTESTLGYTADQTHKLGENKLLTMKVGEFVNRALGAETQIT